MDIRQAPETVIEAVLKSSLAILMFKKIHHCILCECVCVYVCAQSCLTLCGPMNIVHQTPLFMGFLRQESQSGLPFPTPGDHPNPETEPAFPVSPAISGRFFTTETPENP